MDTVEQALTPPLRADDPFNMQGRLSVCDFWKVSPAPAAVKQAVVASTPALLMEGEFDPVNPPSNGQLAASTLANGTYLLFPGLGHGTMYTGPCPLQVALDFLETANKPADTSCIAQMGEPVFA